MDSLFKEVIEKLSHEEDIQLLVDVLDFYEYMKQKKLKKVWQNIKEVEPYENEKKVCNQYEQNEHEFLDLALLVQELGLD